MIKPDLLTTQIKHCDYPYWRAWLQKYRDRFGKLIVYFNENNRFPYLDHFMHSVLEPLGNIVFLDQKVIDWGTQDWRNVATNHMLGYSTSEWVASIEGDFFTRDWDKLFNAVDEASSRFDLLGYKGTQAGGTGKYVHPAFWYMKRSVLEKTMKDFSADTNRGCDHFGVITLDAEAMALPIWYTQDNGFPEEDAFHQGGFNQNYFGLDDPNFNFHRGEEFYIYNHYAMKAPVIQSPVFIDIMARMDVRLKKLYPHINPETDERRIFYLV